MCTFCCCLSEGSVWFKVGRVPRPVTAWRSGWVCFDSTPQRLAVAWTLRFRLICDAPFCFVRRRWIVSAGCKRLLTLEVPEGPCTSFMLACHAGHSHAPGVLPTPLTQAGRRVLRRVCCEEPLRRAAGGDALQALVRFSVCHGVDRPN